MSLRFAIACLAILLLCGCSYVRSSRRIDMAPFAENTISLVAEISYGLNRQRSVYLRQYLHEPPIIAYQERWKHFRPVLRGIATYSLALVTVSKSNLKEKERLDQLAKFLDRMFRPVVDQPVHDFRMTSEELDEVLANIRNQKNFLDGIGAAQPLIDEVAHYSGANLDLIKEAEQEAAAWLTKRITEDNADVVTFDKQIKAAQARSIRSLILLADYRSDSDPATIEQLRNNDPQLAQFIPETTELSPAEMKDVEDRLLYRLAELRDLKGQIAVDFENYHQQIRELDDLVSAASDNLIRTRSTIWVWSRAHARLAAGITDPAKVDLMGIARRALNAAIPY